jgi:hypothetical protein
MKYVVELSKDEDDFYYSVVEKNTDQVIISYFFEDDAKDYCKFLNNGGAFDGFTPAFMMIPIDMLADLNQKFSKIATATE